MHNDIVAIHEHMMIYTFMQSQAGESVLYTYIALTGHS
jgi:hypothetical protein